MKEFIYQLVANGDVFYIGRTNDLKRRLAEHIREAKNGGKTKKCQKIRELLEAGHKIQIEKLHECAAGDLGAAEDEHISAVYCPRRELTNSRGGDRNELPAREAAELQRKIAGWKMDSKTKESIRKSVEASGFEPCEGCTFKCTMMCKKRTQRANERYAAYERGELTLEELKAGCGQ